MTTQNNSDFTELPDVVDRRNSSRVSFATSLGVAVFTGPSVPGAEQFTLVQGSDFSHTGISFTTSTWPASDQLILMLNSQAKTVYAKARIIGCLCLRRVENDTPRFEVRCEFEGWLDGPTS